MMGGSKRPGLRQPSVHHSSIPAHIRSLAQTLTSSRQKTTSAVPEASSSLQQSVGFIVQNQNRSPARRKSPAKQQGTSVTPTTKRPISLQTQSSGYESEAQSSDAWEWTAAEVLWKWQNNNLKTKKVYTDWANHYLEKAHCKKHIQDLQMDVTDGVVLADVIEAVTNLKIPDINKKPKTALQMIENIKTCLAFLAGIGVSLDGITAKDVRDGNLKAILGLFFSLSRHKQRQKQQHQLSAEKDKLQRLQEQRQQAEDMPQPRLPSPYNKHGGAGTSIPVPATALGRRSGLEKGRQQGQHGVPAGGGLQPPSVVYKCTSAASSRSGSPTGASQVISIPRPSVRSNLADRQGDQTGSRPSLNGSRTSLRVPNSSPYSQPPQAKGSVLDKFKLFNGREKESKPAVGTSKRTSSSSGFSSARSEHSDSSTSLCSDARNSGILANERIETVSPAPTSSTPDHSSPRFRGLRPKLTKTGEKKAGSPRLRRSTGSTDAKSEKVRGIADGERKLDLGEVTTERPVSAAPKTVVDERPPPPPVRAPTTGLLSAQSPGSATQGAGSAIPVPMAAPLSPGSGIPKPMAAVKGTSKVPQAPGDAMVPDTPLKGNCPSVPQLPSDIKRDDVFVALVSPMRVSVNEDDLNLNNEQQEEKKGKEEEEQMEVKPMSPLLNGYRLGGHMTHPGYIQNAPKAFYNQYKDPRIISLQSLNLAGYLSDGDLLRNMNQSNLAMDTPDGYISEGGVALIDRKHSHSQQKRVEVHPLDRGRDAAFESSHQRSDLSGDELYYHNKEAGYPESDGWPGVGDGAARRGAGGRQGGRKVDSAQQSHHQQQLQQPGPDHIIRSREHRSPVQNGVKRGKSKMGVKEERDRDRDREGKSKVRGVPSSFGYVKRSNSGAGSGANGKTETRTAQVSAVPRTKVKVSGGTQTTSDLAHFKSYSLSGTSANQLSQCVRDRLMGSQSLPKPGSSDFSALFHQHRQPQRQHKQPTDGSLSDTAYSNYSDLHNYYSSTSPYSSWLKNNSAYTASLPARASTGQREAPPPPCPHPVSSAFPTAAALHGIALRSPRMTRPVHLVHPASARGCDQTEDAFLDFLPAGLPDAESLESLSSLPAQLQRASLSHNRVLMREGSPSSSHRVNRSNSIRSTKSEKLYPSMLQRSEEPEAYYSVPLASQPTSPTPQRLTYPLSPISSSSSSHGLTRGNLSVYSPGPTHKLNSTDDDIHGSSISLVSTASSLYSTPEEKQAHEIRKLKRELQDSQEKVHTLTSQLSTNAHVVSAFEQSLSNMTQRLQHLTATTEKKDQELMELRRNVELLRQQSHDIHNTGMVNNSHNTPGLPRRHTIASEDSCGPDENGAPMTRQLSADSVSSLNSLSSACSVGSSANCSSVKGKKKKKGWLRSSFSKAFSRSRRNRNGSVSDVEDFRRMQSDADGMMHGEISAPSSPLLSASHNGADSPQSINSITSVPIDHKECDEGGGNMVEDLKKQLREKDLVLTDIRLEALSSAHQLESLKDTVIRMRNELLNLKQDNERLQRIVTSKSLTSSQSSVNHMGSLERRFSLHESSLTSLSSLFTSDGEGGKRVLVSVVLGESPVGDAVSETVVGAIHIGPRTQWDMLDTLARRVLREYVQRVDPATSLGLTGDAILGYHLGEAVRGPEAPAPDLQPCAYLIEPEDTLRIFLRGAAQGSLDSLAFETLVPKAILQRYMSLLSEHRRIILCGPGGTGKSYLANKLAEYLVLKSGKDSTAESIATFNVDHKNSKELRQYLTNVGEQCETNACDLPAVIILDNLHQAASLGEVFNGFLTAKYTRCPAIIGTMNQATCSTTNLQLHHNFRWVLCANHVEPVKGFLGRFLRRRFLDSELRHGQHNNDLARVMEWIPRVWHHLNKFIELHNSSEATIGPRLFLLCPDELQSSQVWFTDLWNYAIVPYLMDAVREGLQLYGRRAPWEDPTHFVLQTYPWADETIHGGPQALLRIRAEDVGFDVGSAPDGNKSSKSSVPSEADGDPLLNMLMRLQEAANYSTNDLDERQSPGDCHSQDRTQDNNLSESSI